MPGTVYITILVVHPTSPLLMLSSCSNIETHVTSSQPTTIIVSDRAGTSKEEKNQYMSVLIWLQMSARGRYVRSRSSRRTRKKKLAESTRTHGVTAVLVGARSGMACAYHPFKFRILNSEGRQTWSLPFRSKIVPTLLDEPDEV